MFSTLVLAAALFAPAAPVPNGAAMPPAGPAPAIVELRGEADGKIRLSVIRQRNLAAAAVGGNVVPAARIIRSVQRVELSEVKDLTVTTVGGKNISKEDAMKLLTSGTVVVISADGKPVSSAYLKLFKDDVLILASPELNGTTIQRASVIGVAAQGAVVFPNQVPIVPVVPPAAAVPAVPAPAAVPAPVLPPPPVRKP